MNIFRKTILVSLILMATSAMAATGKQVSYPSDGETISGMLYIPDNARNRLPAIVVIPEWWGLNDWVKEQASKLADQGYVTLAVDIYRGRVAQTPEEAHELSRGLPEDRALRDMRAAVAYLGEHKNVDPKRIGAIGWCMGGGKARELAENEPALKAVAINYGSVPSDEADARKIRAQVLGIFGGKDKGIPVDSVRKFEAQMKKLGRPVEVVIYPEAGHAFENPNNKQGYRADDAADAWRRIVAFFGRALKG